MGMTIATLIEKFQEDISWLGYNETEREIIKHIKYAIILLKEQDPLAVDESKVNKCICGNEINRYWHPEYCGFCGKKLEWY